MPISAANIAEFLSLGRDTDAGIVAGPERSLRHSAVWACLRVRSETWASLPFKVYQKRSGGGSDEVKSHPLAELLRDMNLREALTWHLDAWGNGYLELERSSSGEIAGWEILFPNETQAERGAGGSRFVISHAGPTARAIPARNVLHLAGPGWDGISGYPVLEYHADTVAYPMAARRAGSRLLANDGRPQGVIQVPKPLATGAGEGIRSEFEAHQTGRSFGRTAVLGAGAEYKSIGLPPNSMQFIEQMDAGLLDIARLYMVPPHKIGFLRDAGDRANIEHENFRFATDVQLPLSRRWEGRLMAVALSELEREAGIYVRVDLRGVLRADFLTRMQGYALQRQWGLASANELRALEEKPPIPGSAGNDYLVPLNMTPAEKLGAEPAGTGAPPPAPGSAPPPAADQGRPGGRSRGLWLDAARRLGAQERQALAALAGEDPETRDAGLERFWRQHRRRVLRAFAPLLAFAGSADPVELDELAARYLEDRRGVVADSIEDRKLAERLEAWDELGEQFVDSELERLKGAE